MFTPHTVLRRSFSHPPLFFSTFLVRLRSEMELRCDRATCFKANMQSRNYFREENVGGLLFLTGAFAKRMRGQAIISCISFQLDFFPYFLKSMELQGIWNPWNSIDSLEFHGNLSMESMEFMDFYGVHAMEFHGICWNPLINPWSSMDSKEIKCFKLLSCQRLKAFKGFKVDRLQGFKPLSV